MPIVLDVPKGRQEDLDAVFDYFAGIDRRFSTYKKDSEISRINRGEATELSTQMQEVFAIAEATRKQTGGFFNMRRSDGLLDPSGIVKGWALHGAAELLRARDITDFYIDAGGDIQTSGLNAQGQPWRIGIRSPFVHSDIIKIIEPHGAGVATSGSSARGAHIWNPHAPGEELEEILSITVVGPNVLEADRFATAAFAMGRRGIEFIEALPGFEGYNINRNGLATQTSGFSRYTL